MEFLERCLHTEGVWRSQAQGQPGYILGLQVKLQSFFQQEAPRLGWPILAKQDGGGSKKRRNENEEVSGCGWPETSWGGSNQAPPPIAIRLAAPSAGTPTPWGGEHNREAT